MDHFETRAYAKINLSLDVTGRLENGYHLVRMVMQTVGIYDVLKFEKTKGEITVVADNKELPSVQDNLIYKAVSLMKETYGISGGVKVLLEKNIPIAAGMAGGSTDAAAALKAMNALYELDLSLQELQKLGVRLGADIPYCLLGGTALAEGIGEILTPLPDVPRATLLVAKPAVGVSTKEVYEELDSREIPSHPDVEGMLSAIRQGDLTGITDRLGNVLETVTVSRHPVIGQIKKRMLECGARGSLMSGSGPTVFGIFDTVFGAEQALLRIRSENLASQVFVTEFVSGR